MFDMIIKGGSVLDGSGTDDAAMDIGIRNGKIAALGRLEGSESIAVIDADGKTVTPGFLDIHRHADLAVFQPGFGELELRQGLTTIINGNCGMSAAPFGNNHRDAILDYLSPVIGVNDAVPNVSVSEYLRAVRSVKLPLNVGLLAGSGVIRANAAGFAAGPLSQDQLNKIHQSIDNALSEDALGVSLGLGYAPDCFYNTADLIEALAPLQNAEIPLAVHMRDEGTNVDRSVEEMLTVARALRCPVELSHLKAIGIKNWKRKIPALLETLSKARENGLQVRWDVYPYTAGSTQLLHVLPPEVLEGGTDALTRRLGDPAVRAHIRRRRREARTQQNLCHFVALEACGTARAPSMPPPPFLRLNEFEKIKTAPSTSRKR